MEVKNECQCDRCKQMCRTNPCLGTPADILRLVGAGHAAKLGTTLWLAGVPYGLAPIRMVQPVFDNQKKSCVFLDANGLCTLHDAGLKPTEGKLSSCKPMAYARFADTLTYRVAATWKERANQPLILKLRKLLEATK